MGGIREHVREKLGLEGRILAGGYSKGASLGAGSQSARTQGKDCMGQVWGMQTSSI